MYKILFLLSFLISISTSAQIPVVEISQIQGSNKSSIYEGARVKVERKQVTFVGFDRFFIQTPVGQEDDEPLTSEGIMIYTDAQPSVMVGDLVHVTGSIQEFRGLTEFGPNNLVIDKVGNTDVFHDPIILTPTLPDSLAADIEELEAFEGMLVRFENAVAVGPAVGGASHFPIKVGTTTARAFREPGILFPGQNDLPVFDGNPEVIIIDQFHSDHKSDISSGMQISALTGVLYQRNHQYYIIPVDDNFIVGGSNVLTPVREKKATEVTLASINVERLFSTDNFNRFDKFAKYIINSLRTPDIIAIQEVENIEALNNTITSLKNLSAAIDYSAHLIKANDSDINVGFLVNKALDNPKVTALGIGETVGGSGNRLHDRPPLLLEVNLNNNKKTMLSVLNLHLRSLNGIEEDNADYVRQKRYEQAVSVARIIESLDDENLIVVGDFNAYEFTDGYVDVLAQITGNQSLGAEKSPQSIVSPSLTNYTADLPQEQRYSFIFEGNSQLLDHCLANNLKEVLITDLQFARGNADNSSEYLNDYTSPYRMGDHDGFVLYIETDESVSITDPEKSNQTFTIEYSNPFRSGNTFHFSLSENEVLTLNLYSLDGKVLIEKDLGFRQMGSFSYTPDWDLPKGIYLISVEGKNGRISRKIIF